MSFEYDGDFAIDMVNEKVPANIYCDLTGIEKMAELIGTGDYCFGDLEEQDEEAYLCYERMMDEIYTWLEDHEVIPTNFNEEFEHEAELLGDYIDEQIEEFLERVREDW